MDHPGVWILGDLADDDRGHGMGVVVEYAGASGAPQWVAPQAFRWDYRRFGDANTPGGNARRKPSNDLIDKDNAARGLQPLDHERVGFNR